jgi:hypothetical protein
MTSSLKYIQPKVSDYSKLLQVQRAKKVHLKNVSRFQCVVCEAQEFMTRHTLFGIIRICPMQPEVQCLSCSGLVIRAKENTLSVEYQS